MFLIGVLAVLVPTGGAVLLVWDNRNVIVRVHAGPYVWTGHLYAVLIFGALTACWLLLGVSCVHCRIAELRTARRRASQSPTSEPADTKPARLGAGHA